MQSPGAAAGLTADRPVRVRTSPPPECAAVSKWYLYGIALVAGVANAIEPGQNATLAKVTGQPMLAGLFCFGLAIACFLAAMVVARLRGRTRAEAATPVPGGRGRAASSGPRSSWRSSTSPRRSARRRSWAA